MKKILHFIGLGSSSLVQLIVFGLALVLIFAVAYIVGYRYLLGNTFWGNDSFSYFSVVNWFNSFYPKIPYWFPLQGGGVSLFAGYPWLAAYIVIWVSRLGTIELAQAFRLVGFLSVPLTGVGVFLLAWTRLTDVKPVWMRQVLGLIAALIYTASPIAWIWLARWGFYSENISHIFVPLIIIAFDCFIDRLFSKKYDLVFRLAFMATAVLWLAGFLTHFFVGIAVIPIFILLGLARFIFWHENRITLARRILLPTLMLALAVAGLFVFRYYSYRQYTKAVTLGGFTGYAAPSQATYEETAKNMLSPKMMLSLQGPVRNINDLINFSRATIADMSFPTYVWVLIVPTILFSYFRSKKVFFLSVYTAIGFVINTSPQLTIFLSKYAGPLMFIFGLASGRIFFLTMAVIIPILAAYGGYILWENIGSIVLWLVRGVKVVYYSLLHVKIVVVLILTLASVGVVWYNYYNLPYARHIINAGAFDDKVDLRDIWHTIPQPNYTYQDTLTTQEGDPLSISANFDYMNTLCLKQEAGDYSPSHICSYFWNRDNTKTIRMMPVIPPLDVVQKAKIQCNGKVAVGQFDYCKAFYKPLAQQLAWENWVKEPVSSDYSGETAGLTDMFKYLPSKQKYRYDMSGYTGRYIMTAPLVNTNSQIQIYINTLSLIYNNWNYQTQAMYTKYQLYQKPGVLSEIAKWFGINYVYLTGAPQEPLEDYESDANFARVDGSANWFGFKPDTSLVSWGVKPKVLVLSDPTKYFYDQSFRFFTWGAAPYDQAIPVNGGQYVDAYPIEVLKQFDVLFLRGGYQYKNRSKAYRLLDEYVKTGGRLFIDTGWQYFVPDYQLDSAPDFLPFDSLAWQNLAMGGTYTLDGSLAHINPAHLSPLAWDSKPWGVSVPGSIRSWGRPMVSYNGTPLVVSGEYGKGKVVWVGFNIIQHAEGYNNSEEIRLFNALLGYLTSDSTPKEFAAISVQRSFPDEVNFTFTQNTQETSFVYFRESFYPDWKAYLSTSKGKRAATIWRAGPGFMLVMVPPVVSGDKLVIKIEKPAMQTLTEVVGVSTLLLLMLYIVVPKAFYGFYTDFIKGYLLHRATTSRVKGKLGDIYTGWKNPEDD